MADDPNSHDKNPTKPIEDSIIPTAKVPQSLALTPSEWAHRAAKTYAESMAQANAALLQDCTPEEIALIHDFFHDVQDSSATFEKLAKDRLLLAIKTNGKQVTKKGSLALDLGNGRYVQAGIKSTKKDPKKVEQLLRSKGLDPDVHMDVEHKHHTNEVKLLKLLVSEHVTQEELDACVPEKVYTLGKSKKIPATGMKEMDDE